MVPTSRAGSLSTTFPLLGVESSKHCISVWKDTCACVYIGVMSLDFVTND